MTPHTGGDDVTIIRPASDIIQSIHRALSTGQHMRARKLSEVGVGMYPDDLEMRKIARILAPPRVIRAFKAGEAVER